MTSTPAYCSETVAIKRFILETPVLASTMEMFDTKIALFSIEICHQIY
jgi:hypothetical protein